MRSIIMCIAVVLISGFGMKASAQVSKFQALYLVNFTKNLDWPGDKVTIGVVGNTQALIELESLAAKYPDISLKKISGGESVSDCNLIFLPSAQSRNFSLIQGKIGGSPIVLVAEDQRLISDGAELAFYMEGNKLKFVLNKSALDKAGVSVTDKLLSVAKVVN